MTSNRTSFGPQCIRERYMTKDERINEGIKAFAAIISQQPMGLAFHCPSPDAQPNRCLENTLNKVRNEGGRPRFGWTFNYHEASVGGYLVATNHVVWNARDGRVVDVTPYPEDVRMHPVSFNGNTLFLVDDAAEFVVTDRVIAPHPLRYFALSEDVPLRQYLAELSEREQAACKAIYEGRVSPSK